MNRKLVFLIVLLFLVSISSVMLEVQNVEASGTVYIRADGSIDPLSAPIQRVGNVYTLTDNIYDSIVIERDSIVMAGSGYTLQGSGSGTGIDFSGRVNVTIKKMNITSFHYGIYGNSTSQSILSENNITDNTDSGAGGIRLDYSSNNSISGSYIEANGYFGIWLDYSSDNTVSENNITGNNGHAGIFLYSSSENTIYGNNIAANGASGVIVGYLSSNNSISRNNITDNTGNFGIMIDYSSANIVSENNISANKYWGLDLSSSANDNRIFGNNLTHNSWGVRLYESSNNSITGNTIAYNGDGISLEGATASSANGIHHNNILFNSKQVLAETGAVNVWDDGYQGNYWSDYNGTDADNNGIGDTPYINDVNNTDHYPLMNIIPEFPSLLMLPLFMIAALLTVIIYKKKEKLSRATSAF